MKIFRLVAVVLCAGLIASCSSSPSTQSTVTVTSPAPGAASPSTSAAASGPITIPDFPANENAEIVRKKLEDLGLTNVQLTPANPKYSLVIRAANWTLVSIEPPPGTVVAAGDPVIVKVTKP